VFVHVAAGAVFVEAGVCTLLVDVLQNFRDHPELVERATQTLLHLCADPARLKVHIPHTHMVLKNERKCKLLFVNGSKGGVQETKRNPNNIYVYISKQWCM
jgi:hypothetical protein